MMLPTTQGFTKLSPTLWLVVTLLILAGSIGCQKTLPATAPIESRTVTTEFLLGPETSGSIYGETRSFASGRRYTRRMISMPYRRRAAAVIRLITGGAITSVYGL